MTDTPSSSDYPGFLAALKDRVLQDRTSAVRVVNIWRMRAFYLAYSKGDIILAQAVQELNGAMPHAAIPEEDRLPRLRTLLETLYDGTHLLRIALDKLQTLDTVRIIERKV